MWAVPWTQITMLRGHMVHVHARKKHKKAVYNKLESLGYKMQGEETEFYPADSHALEYGSKWFRYFKPDEFGGGDSWETEQEWLVQNVIDPLNEELTTKED